MLRFQPCTIHVKAINVDTGLPVPGDAANINLARCSDDAVGAIAASVSEPDGTNLPGIYTIALTGLENDGLTMAVDGFSTTTGVVIQGRTWINVDAASYGVVTANGTATQFQTNQAGVGDDFWNRQFLTFLSGNNRGQSRRVVDFADLNGTFDFTGDGFSNAALQDDEFMLTGFDPNG